MRLLPTTILSLLLFPAFAQDTPKTLANQLTGSKATDKQKVTAIFNWITENISYSIVPKQPSESGPRLPINDDFPDELTERMAMQVINRRTAFCEGYARLFKSLCDHAGISATIIRGYARNERKERYSRFGVNHYWNAVFFDNKWHLLDATWASGYVSPTGDQFIKSYAPGYFLSSPDKFLEDHYPEDIRWTLLPEHHLPEEFRFSPFRQKPFSKYAITSFYPDRGIIEARIGETIVLKVETKVNANISPDMSIDSSLFSYSPQWVFLKPGDPVIVAGDKQVNEYSYRVSSTGVKWIFLLYNDDIVLRYRIIVKETGTGPLCCL
jgi:hypothetical protein